MQMKMTVFDGSLMQHREPSPVLLGENIRYAQSNTENRPLCCVLAALSVRLLALSKLVLRVVGVVRYPVRRCLLRSEQHREPSPVLFVVHVQLLLFWALTFNS